MRDLTTLAIIFCNESTGNINNEISMVGLITLHFNIDIISGIIIFLLVSFLLHERIEILLMSPCVIGTLLPDQFIYLVNLGRLNESKFSVIFQQILVFIVQFFIVQFFIVLSVFHQRRIHVIIIYQSEK